MTRSHRAQLRYIAVAAIGATLMASCCAPGRTGLQAVSIEQDAPRQPNSMNSELPPVEYQALRTGTASLTFYVPRAAVDTVCQQLGVVPAPGYTIRGCTMVRDGVPTMILPNPCEDPGAYMTPSYVACHELGHVNGWNHGD